MAPHLDDGGLDDADGEPATGGGGAGARTAGGEQYFSRRPASRSDPRRIAVRLPDVRLDLVTDRGVFAGARLDPGTETLLRRGELVVPDGPVLDLGCGYGPIALTLARRNPAAAIWAVDVNERARDLCRENVRASGLANVARLSASARAGSTSCSWVGWAGSTRARPAISSCTSTSALTRWPAG